MVNNFGNKTLHGRRPLQAECQRGREEAEDNNPNGALSPGGRPRVKNSSCITCSPSSLRETMTFHAACSTGCQPLQSRVVRRVSNACLPAYPELHSGLIHLLNPPFSPHLVCSQMGHMLCLAIEHLVLD